MISDKTLSNPKRRYQVVIAATRDMGIGINQELPWDLPTDFKFFNDVTTITWNSDKRNAVIMGRKSWESTPIEIRPLPGRLNVVLTRTENHDIQTDEQNVVVLNSMDSALELLATQRFCESIETVFVIGGGDLLRNYMNAPECDAIHLTEVDISVECDAFAPPVDKELYRPWYSSCPIVENQTRFCFNTYIRRSETVGSEEIEFSFLPKMVLERHEQFSYFNLVQEIVSGSVKNDTQGQGTFSKFGCQVDDFDS